MIYVGAAALYLSAIISVVLMFAMPRLAKDRRKADAIATCYWWIIGVFGLLTASVLVLLAAFVVKDYSFDYVASYSSAEMLVQYRMAALWAGHEGSLLLWAWMLGGFSAAIAAFRMSKRDKLDTYALAVLNDVQVFLLAILIVAADPFKVSPLGTVAGQGINPLLLHWAMIIHPPTLFVGYAGLTVPFAYAVAAAWARDGSAKWVTLSQRWTIFSWLFLSIGIFLGALWAYVVLGWGGFWGWDPVENASFLPWLTATALIHSFTVYKRRGLFKVWSLSLSVTTFLLVILATFITRGGLISSVHGFERNNVLIALFSGFIVLTLGISGQLIASRYELFRGHEELNSLASKEFMYFINNLVLLLSTVIILVATMLPLFRGPALKPESYNTIAQPIGIAYALVLALCPMFAWRKTDSERVVNYALAPAIVTAVAAVPLFFYWRSLVDMVRQIDPAAPAKPLGYLGLLVAVFAFASALELFFYGASAKAKRSKKSWPAALGSLFIENRSQAGGYLTHLGVAVILAGLIGSTMFVGDINQAIAKKPGETIDVLSYRLRLEKVIESPARDGVNETATFNVVDKATGKTVSVIEPRATLVQTGQDAGKSRQTPAIMYQPFRDIFVAFSMNSTKDPLAVNVKINPLIMFVWSGSIILVLGMLIAYWPRWEKSQAA